jgi:hypothetical protein
MSTWRTAAPLGVLLLFVQGSARAQPASQPTSLGHDEDDFLRLRAELDRANAAVAELKRAGRSVRNDYRLRERMADAEALAQRVTEAEARLRSLRGGAPSPGRNAIVPPQAVPQDGSVELEAKADLFADQAKRLLVEADALSKAAQQIRSRKALRRQAGAWDRDPFSGLESSKRNMAISAAKVQAAAPGTDGPRVVTGTPASNPTFAGTTGTVGSSPTTALTPGSTTMDGKGVLGVATPEGATAAKSAPLPASPVSERSAVEQRLFLDPATASELRQALGSAGENWNADALEQAATLLRTRARGLELQARALLAKSRAP